MKSFHAQTQVRMPTVAFIGMSSGKMIRPEDPPCRCPVDPRGLFELDRDRADVRGVDEDVQRQAVDRVQDDQPGLVVQAEDAVCLTSGSMMIGNGMNSAARK